jgi:hypothetical protein
MDMNVNMCVNMAGTQIAQKTQSLEFCDELGTPDQKESCKFGIVINKSQAEKNISLCDKLWDTYKSRCKSEYYKSEAVRLKDPKLCENIGKTVSGEANPEDSRDRDQCAMSIVLSNPDTTAEDCKSIKDENIRELCTVNVTRMKERALPPQQ